MPGTSQQRTLLVLFAVNLLNFYDRIVPGALAEPIRKEFSLTDAQLGWLSTSFTLLYAVVGIPLARLADRTSRRLVLAAGVAVWSSLTAVAGVAATYSVLLLSRLGVAVGEAVCAPAATSWIGDLFPAERRSRAMAFFMLAVPIGGSLGFFVCGPLAQVFGWRTAVVLAAAPAVVLVPLLLRLHEPRRGGGPLGPAVSPWTILRIPTMWWIIASGALLNFNMYVVSAFLPAFVSRIHGFSLAEAGVAAGITYGLGGLLGGMAAGVWGDRAARRGVDGRMLAAAATTLLAAPLAAAGILQPAGRPVAALLFIGCAFGLLSTYYGLVYASIHEVVGPSLRATAMAVYFLFMYLGGASFGPLLTGALSDHLARQAAGGGPVTEAARAVGLNQAMLVIPVLSAGLAAVLWAGSRTIRRDASFATPVPV